MVLGCGQSLLNTTVKLTFGRPIEENYETEDFESSMNFSFNF